jgi:hypothetical protein
MTIAIKNFKAPVSLANDEEIKARVFRDPEVRKPVLRLKNDGAVHHPRQYGRTFSRHLRAWWYLRQQRAMPKELHNSTEAVSEPDWPRHWALTKYI